MSLQPYSERQLIFAQYLLSKIGIEESDMREYLGILARKYGEEYRYPERGSGGRLTGTGISVKPCIDFLLEEVSIKKNEFVARKLSRKTEKFTATNLSSIIFCPISFVISETFEIESSKLMKTGQKLHLRNKLSIPQCRVGRGSDVIETELFSKIKNSKLLFSGHSKEDVLQNFQNTDEGFIGTPDYIFQDSNNSNFVVEEKYRFTPISQTNIDFTDRETVFSTLCQKEIEDVSENIYCTNFFLNHIIQTYSYIRNIEQFNLQYGYVFYWNYTLFEKHPIVYGFSIKKISPSRALEGLYQETKRKFFEILSGKEFDFDTKNISITKCLNCSVSKYCGHKSKKVTNYKFPYNKSYFELKHVPFPVELKKNNAKINNLVDTSEVETIEKLNENTYEYYEQNKSQGRLSPIEEKNILNLYFPPTEDKTCT